MVEASVSGSEEGGGEGAAEGVAAANGPGAGAGEGAGEGQGLGVGQEGAGDVAAGGGERGEEAEVEAEAEEEELICGPCAPSGAGERGLGEMAGEVVGGVKDPWAGAERAQSQRAMEAEFWKYFGRRVLEWNPCFSEEGERRVRFSWSAALQAHDVEADVAEVESGEAAKPERARLGAVLEEVFAAEERGESLDLGPLRRLVAALVQTSGRHDRHGKGPPDPKKDPCARGSEKCPYCRYGFPHRLVARGGARRMHLERGDREGQWDARFPRNDALCTSYEPHLLLANGGNVDWRPCMNLWAVVEYVTKYATKAPEGSRALGEVLRSAMDEVSKYSVEGEGVDLMRRSLQKFYARCLGERSYGVFEAVRLGLGLPLVIPMNMTRLCPTEVPT